MTVGGRLLLWDRKLSPTEVWSDWLGDHHCFRFRCDPTRLVITDAIAAAESGPTHNRLDMSCPTAKMTGISKAATNNDNDNGNGRRAR